MVDAAKHLQLSDTKLRLGWKVYVDQPKHGVVKVLWCSPLKNRTRPSEIGRTHDGYEECNGRGHRAG
jgi:hypothetical protein